MNFSDTKQPFSEYDVKILQSLEENSNITGAFGSNENSLIQGPNNIQQINGSSK